MSRELKASDELQNTYVEDRVEHLLPIFEALAPYKTTQRKKGVGDIPGWERLAAQEARNLKINYPEDGKTEAEKTYGTCHRQITALKKALKEAATKEQLDDPALVGSVRTIITNFGNALSFLFVEYKERQNITYRKQVKERSHKESRLQIDLTKNLKRACELLTALANGDNTQNWLDVSCAVALTTGRRMSEVHLSASFEQVGEYEVNFSGQLKGKTRRVDGQQLKNVVFTIPTLIPASLVCAGLQWLGDKGKRFPHTEDPERVNRRWSKVLNLAAKDWEVMPEMTYHKFRAAYFRASLINANVDPFDYVDFARKTLGDDDEATIKAYQRFEIIKNSITKM